MRPRGSSGSTVRSRAESNSKRRAREGQATDLELVCVRQVQLDLVDLRLALLLAFWLQLRPALPLALPLALRASGCALEVALAAGQVPSCGRVEGCSAGAQRRLRLRLGPRRGSIGAARRRRLLGRLTSVRIRERRRRRCS